MFNKTLKAELRALREEVRTLKEAIDSQGRSLFRQSADAAPGQFSRVFAEAVAFRGDHENRLYRAFAGTIAPFSSRPSPVPFTSGLCSQWHFLLDQYRFWAAAMKDNPKFMRKQWEFVFIAQVLHERGYLESGRRGLVFGVGREPLPSLFASFGCEIVATDQSIASAAESGWIKSGEHAPDITPLNDRGICTDRMFSELVSFAVADMNDIPSSFDQQFDFVWSACSLEHLGSLQKGCDFIENSLRTLKPGGIAVHTTEFNMSSDFETIESDDLTVYRKSDIESLFVHLSSKGFRPSPIDWSVGDGFAETVVDLPPWGRGEPHIRLRLGDFDVTSIGLIIEKPFTSA